MLRLFAVLNARISYQRGRSFLSILGIALGVALGFAVHLINRAAVSELAAGVRTLAGEADLEVGGGGGPGAGSAGGGRRFGALDTPHRDRFAARSTHPADVVRRRARKTAGAV